MLHIPTVRQIVGHLGWRMRPIQGISIHNMETLGLIFLSQVGFKFVITNFTGEKKFFFFCFMFFLSL